MTWLCGRYGWQGKGEAEEMKPIVPPPIVGPSEFSKAVMESLKGYESTWLDRDESENFSQKHDEELARGVVRPTVEEEVRKQVDAMLEDQLANFKKQLAGAGKGKKAGKVPHPSRRCGHIAHMCSLTHTDAHTYLHIHRYSHVHIHTCTLMDIYNTRTQILTRPLGYSHRHTRICTFIALLRVCVFVSVYSMM